MPCRLAPVLSYCVSWNTNNITPASNIHTQHATPEHLEVLLTEPGTQTDASCTHNPDAVACYQKRLHAWCGLMKVAATEVRSLEAAMHPPIAAYNVKTQHTT